MTSDELTTFEAGLMEMLLAGDNPVLQTLRCQLRGSRVKSRELTGCGFFTYFGVDRSAAMAVSGHPSLRISDVDAVIPGLEHGAGFVLFVEDGYLDNLEGYSYDELWPTEDITAFKLRYTGGVRDLGTLGIDPSGT